MGLFSRNKKVIRTPEQETLWLEHQAFFKTKIPKRTPVEAIRFIVLDTETDGLDPKKNRILSIAAVEVENFEMHVAQRFESFFYRETYAPDETVKVHGILGKHLEEGDREAEILKALVPYLKNSILVGHHIGFDIAILNEAFQRHFQFSLQNQTLDTATLAQRLENPHQRANKPPSLDALCEQYRIPLGIRHTAAGDTFITALLFLKLLGRLKGRRVDTVRELMVSGF